jgi:hypothetical protein
LSTERGATFSTKFSIGLKGNCKESSTCLKNAYIRSSTDACHQGDQIGRTFAYRLIVYFGQVKKKYRSSQKSCADIIHSYSYVLISTNIGLATFWAIFSQTHLVTLLALLVEEPRLCMGVRGIKSSITYLFLFKGVVI